jgi:micrococcal nuclease
MRYIIVWFLLATVTLADEYRYKAEVLSVHDGDTITALVDLGFDVHVKMKLRLKDVYAPEFNQEGGASARQMLVNLLPTNINITVFKTKGGNVVKSFDRYIVNIDGVNDKMIKWLKDNKLTGGIGL